MPDAVFLLPVELSMAKQRHLTKAPISEALVDFHVAPADDLTHETLVAALDPASFGYYQKAALREGTLEVKLPEDDTAPTHRMDRRLVGLRLHSHDERWVAQFRLGGLTVSRLPPYRDWEELSAEARRLWTIYVERLRPTRVRRLATRFINRLSLPQEPQVALERYIERLTDLPPDLPQAVASFFQRFHLVDVSNGGSVIVTLALKEAQPGTPPFVLLDVDAFSLVDLDVQDAAVWEKLGRLHDLKNRCFFGTITEHTAEMYQ